MNSNRTLSDDALKPLMGDWLRTRAQDHPDDVATVDLAVKGFDTERQTTYGEMYDRSRRISSVLAETYGIGKGDRVMVAAYNAANLYEILFACWRLGAAYMPINWRLAPPEVHLIADDATPSVIIADLAFESLVSDIDIPVWWRDGNEDVDPFEQAIAATQPWDGFVTPDLDAMTTLLYTSGTTGQPKGVISTWRMQCMAVNQALHTNLGRDTRTLTAAPLFHTAGLNSFALPLFSYGGTVHIMRHWDPDAALKYLSDPDLGITHTLGVPVQFQMMTQCTGFANARFSTVERAGVGGAPVTEELLSQFQSKGMTLCNSYGMTEVFGVATLAPDLARTKIGSVGFPVRGTEIRIADENDSPVDSNVTGEIQIKSRGVTPGYWQAPDLTAAAHSKDGWYKTGDVGRLDEEGALYVVDRKKDMYISGGENVYPAEVENVLATFPEIAQSAVVGVPDSKWGETGHAVIVLKAGHHLDGDIVTQRCREQLARFKVPKHVSFTDELPRSGQGKVLKIELRKTYAG
ncbi:MAG: AMP-binding protein [Rhodospirillaceae bacterium]|jgi:fatty-acyl-CoA synthase|nr:AMP-binding protein [Rhodospirillaceae bacterium]